MNEEAQKALAELLQKTLSGIDTVVGFSQVQLPEVIQQLLVWNAVSSLLIQVVSIIYLVVFIKYTPKIIRHMFRCNCPTSEAIYLISLIVASVIALVATIQSFDNFDWIKIWLAPKLYLIEYASYLLK